MTGKYRIEDGSNFRLKRIDPDDTGNFSSREEAEERTRQDLEKLAELHERFYVDNRYSLLIVMQAMDTGGKDGAIKACFRGINPQGCQVTSFKAPSAEERDHDFLWRIGKALPARGTFGIFNRSHYEDVLIVRVHDLVPKDVWKKRYQRINLYERVLAGENTVIVKFFLYISKEEQKRRLEARLSDPTKTWKFEPGDLEERKHWDDYLEAYEDVIRKCSAPHAPWYVVPANKKWFRNFVVVNALVKTLSKLKLQYPTLKYDPRAMRVE